MSIIASNDSSRISSAARALRLLRSPASVLAAAVALAGCDPGDIPRTRTCDGGGLRPVPADPSERGPWTVGVRTVEVEGLDVEVWYPAGRFSESTRRPVMYDLREYLPTADRARISDEDAPWQPCDCYRDVPADLAHGPYPVVVFLHAKGGFRTQSLPQMLHWASRGFVVLAADHPGLRVSDVLTRACNDGITPRADVRRDVEALLSALREHDHAFAFLGRRLDPTRVAIAGHSHGGLALESFGDLAQVLIPMAAKGTRPGDALESTLVLGGTADTHIPYTKQQHGYATSPAPKRLVGIANAGHLAFSTFCTITNSAGQGLAEILHEAGVCGASVVIDALECDDELLPAPEAWEVIDRVTAAVIEETLYCDPDAARAFETLEADYSVVAELREEL
jgi:dienelactone hydrolase